jgi:hypothetical protein
MAEETEPTTSSPRADTATARATAADAHRSTLNTAAEYSAACAAAAGTTSGSSSVDSSIRGSAGQGRTSGKSFSTSWSTVIPASASFLVRLMCGCEVPFAEVRRVRETFKSSKSAVRISCA